ncbi:hypothetical protein [Salinicola rhizosphaerae]|uniref:Phage protein n=1 Tax=Salinicola rhizosphaerae TaxID=1443141 RepID=A0ABQ3E303_9GAMM|nr:hypothetical protein [Salinicola rhizosphaerae]GHB24168.1 hypothetical protein GCM10009038_24050 [Salinicola rhizosphaerae]
MAKRKPATLAGDVPSRQQIWESIRTLKASQRTITMDRLNLLLPKMPESRITDYLRGLVAAGYVERRNPNKAIGDVAEYELIRDIGFEAPRVRRDGSEPPVPGREQLWRTMKIIGEFTAQELADAATTPARSIAVNTAHEYCQFLAHANYLHITRASGPNLPARYRLASGRWTGPMAPQIRRTKELYDPNTKAVVYSRVTKTEGGEP